MARKCASEGIHPGFETQGSRHQKWLPIGYAGVVILTDPPLLGSPGTILIAVSGIYLFINNNFFANKLF